MSPALAGQPTKTLQDPELKARLQQLRQTDNVTNWLYIVLVYVYLAAVIGGTVAFYQHYAAWGLSFWWNVPVTLLAGVLIGAGPPPPRRPGPPGPPPHPFPHRPPQQPARRLPG